MGQPYLLLARLTLPADLMTAWKAAPVRCTARPDWGTFGEDSAGGARAALTSFAALVRHIESLSPRARVTVGPDSVVVHSVLVDGDYYDGAATLGSLAAAGVALDVAGWIAGGILDDPESPSPEEVLRVAGDVSTRVLPSDKRQRKRHAALLEEIDREVPACMALVLT